VRDRCVALAVGSNGPDDRVSRLQTCEHAGRAIGPLRGQRQVRAEFLVVAQRRIAAGRPGDALRWVARQNDRIQVLLSDAQ